VDLPELLRSQAKRYKCAACGENMAECGINVLAQQGNRALVRVTCKFCNDENLLQIIFQTEGDLTDDADKEVARNALLDAGRPEIEEPISNDELLDVHQFLNDFNAGFKELVNPRS
jgi:hypothetical protein